MRTSDQPTAARSDPMVLLAPEDTDTAFTGGVRFARALAGVDAVAFVMALGEQEAQILAAVIEASARVEWRRIGSLERPVV